jgi:succinoglycan biosynthesis transport protein ExoP
MMEGIKFLNILKKHRYGLLIIPILVMLIVFFLVRKNADVYFSKSRLSAGIISEVTNESQDMTEEKVNTQEATTSQEFTNLLQTMQLKIVFDQVSYQLILHDLTSDDPFRKQSKLMTQLNQSARQHAIDIYTKLYTNRQPLNLNNPDQKGLYQVIQSMGYDEGSIKDKIRIYRVENSDFIDIYYESDNPLLSQFVVNS